MSSVGGREPQADLLAPQLRPARALLGFMPQDVALRLQQQNQAGVQPDQRHQQRYDAARAAVAHRQKWSGTSKDFLQEPPVELHTYVGSLLGNPTIREYLTKGFEVKLVDLRQVCALQQTVFMDHALERTAYAASKKLTDVIGVTLPIPDSTRAINAQFDESRNAWMFTSRNPNLRIAGHFGGPIKEVNNMLCFGFVMDVATSLMQVVAHNGRPLLIDGYHRAIGLLRQNVYIAPVLYRTTSDNEIFSTPPQLLPASVYLSDRPALLPDYLDDRFAADILIPGTTKFIVIEGLELNPLS